MTNANTPAGTAGRKQRRWVAIGAAGLLAATVAGAAVSAGAHSGWRGDGPDLNRFVERKVDRMLNDIDIGDDQRSKLHDIVKTAVADLQEFRGLGRETRRDLIAALTGETIDRDELEALRQRKLETADRASQRMVTALADAAAVLTSAQRAELAAKWKERMSRHEH